MSDKDDCRVEFEKWCRGKYNLCRNASKPEEYSFSSAKAAWAAWQYVSQQKREQVYQEALEASLYRFRELLAIFGNHAHVLKRVQSHNIPMIERVLTGGPLL